MNGFVICIEKGGLGINSLSTLNKTLLGKWPQKPGVIRTLSRKGNCKEMQTSSKGVEHQCAERGYEEVVCNAIKDEWEIFKAKTCFKVGSCSKLKL